MKSRRERSPTDEGLYQQWLAFKKEFPKKKDDDPLAHLKWVEEHKDDPSKYNVPFAEYFATPDVSEYDRAGRDHLVVGITTNIHALPKGKAMPCVQTRGSTDIAPRAHVDDSLNWVRNPTRTERMRRAKEAGEEQVGPTSRRAPSNAAQNNMDTTIGTRKRQRPPVIDFIANKKGRALHKVLSRGYGLEAPWNPRTVEDV